MNFLDAAGLARFFAGLGQKFATLSHTHGTADIEDGAITTAKLANMAVTTSKLGNKCVANGNLGDMSVQEGKIYPQAVTTTKIRDGAVTEDKLDAALAAKINAGGGALSIDEVVGSGLDHYTYDVSGTYLMLDEFGATQTYEWNDNISTSSPSPHLTIVASDGGVHIETPFYEKTITPSEMAQTYNQATPKGFRQFAIEPNSSGTGAQITVTASSGSLEGTWTTAAALSQDIVETDYNAWETDGTYNLTHNGGQPFASDLAAYMDTPFTMTSVTVTTFVTQTEQLTFVDGTTELTVPYTRHLGENEVDTDNIKDDAVTLDKIANEAVDFAQLKKAATSRRIASNRTLTLNGTYTVGASYPFGNYTFLLVVCDYVYGTSYPDATKYAYLIPAPAGSSIATLKGSRFVSDGTIAGFGWYDFELTFAGSTRVVTLTKSKLIKVQTTASPWAVTAEDVKMRISAIYGIR